MFKSRLAHNITSIIPFLGKPGAGCADSATPVCAYVYYRFQIERAPNTETKEYPLTASTICSSLVVLPAMLGYAEPSLFPRSATSSSRNSVSFAMAVVFHYKTSCPRSSLTGAGLCEQTISDKEPPGCLHPASQYYDVGGKCCLSKPSCVMLAAGTAAAPLPPLQCALQPPK